MDLNKEIARVSGRLLDLLEELVPEEDDAYWMLVDLHDKYRHMDGKDLLAE